MVESAVNHFLAEIRKSSLIEGPLVLFIEKASETIRPHLRERQRLVDLFFEEKLE
jgi:hypothetical protein